MAKSMINLTRGAPPVDAFPTEDLIRSGEKSLKRDGNVLLQYGRSPGYPPLREWLAGEYHAASDSVMLGNSSLELLQFLIQCEMHAGERVFIEAPSYDRTITLLKRAGIEIVAIPLEDDGWNMEIFEAELKKGVPSFVYTIADFQNPMGITMSLEKRQQLSRWAEQYGFWIIEDSPYRLLRYRGKEVPTIMSLNPARVIQMSSFSKLLAPGLRMGFLFAPAAMVKRLSDWAVDTYIGPVTPTQGMVYEYCAEGLMDANLKRLKALYKPKMEATISAIRQYIPAAEFPEPDGGYYVGLTLPKGNTMKGLLDRAPEAGLKLTDGRGFYLNPADGERFLRIPFCSLAMDEIDDAIQRLADILI